MAATVTAGSVALTGLESANTEHTVNPQGVDGMLPAISSSPVGSPCSKVEFACTLILHKSVASPTDKMIGRVDNKVFDK